MRAELHGHEADVRGVACSSTASLVATASRDSTVALWSLGDATGLFAPVRLMRGHNHFVNAVAFSASSDDMLVSASSDHSMRVWKVSRSGDVVSAECVGLLEGHTANICHVTVLPSDVSKMISCSWDMTARIWDLRTCTCDRVLEGHDAAVWSALALSQHLVVTVSADKTIRSWNLKSGSCQVLPPAHTDVIRSVASAPGGGFVSVSNDSTAVYWKPTPTGSFEPASRLGNLHDGSFIYSIAGVKLGESDDVDNWIFVSGGEDNNARVFAIDSGGQTMSCLQTIAHPGVVWAVAFTSQGDILSGCSDGMARIFTRNSALVADDSLLQSFENSVSDKQISTKVIGNVDVAKLPTAKEGLGIPGNKDGENKLVRTADGSAEVHMWSAADSRWQKIGDLVDGPSGGISAGSGEVRGKLYDFVFEVEIGEGGRKEKLGFNRGENVYVAAQRFIDDNDLSPEFLDQIVNFVEQQVPADALSISGSSGSDPLTGGSRYVPGGVADPLPSNAGNRADNRDMNAAPMSASQPSSSEARLPLPPPRKYLPHASGIVIYTMSDHIEKIQAKLADTNSNLATSNADAALTQGEAEVFGMRLMPKLKEKRGNSSLIFDDEECAVVGKMLMWPTSVVFPVLDIARLVIFHPSAGAYFFGRQNGEVLSVVLQHMSSAESSSAVLLMGCRFLCNMFGNRVVASVARSRCREILDAAASASKSENRRARETHGSLLVNYAVALHDASASLDERSVPLQVGIKLLNDGEHDEEVAFRLLVAVGTLMCGGKEMAQKGLALGAAAAAAAVAPFSARIQQVAHEIAVLVAS